MSVRYLIGRGELLTYPIKAPSKKPGDKAHPYTVAEAKAHLAPQFGAISEAVRALPSRACPDDIAVAKLTLHPAYIAKSYFPSLLLDQAGLVSIGSRTVRVRPRKVTRKSGPDSLETTELYVAGRRANFRGLASWVASIDEELPVASQLIRVESVTALTVADRLRENEEAINASAFEAVLHLPPGSSAQQVRSWFAKYAESVGFQVDGSLEFEVGRLLFVPVLGNKMPLEPLAQFSLLRVVRPMPKLRGARPVARSAPVAVSFKLPSSDPLSREPRVAILDGGLPDKHILDPYVRRYIKSDLVANDVPDFTDHGLSVSSAVLFGAIEPGGVAERPYSLIDHYRVLDADIDTEDELELYRTLGHIETVLRSRQYQFINLSLGPDLPMEDQDVHAWTALIDDFLSDGETLMTVAAGNNGDRDAALRLDRVQVPADCVNTLSVGAADRSDSTWKRAFYSAIGPGRSPGRRKPDVVAFGGSPKEYFHVATAAAKPQLSTTFGTSFAAPLALRSAVGIRAVLGDQVHPLTIKALLIHGCECDAAHDSSEVGWGRVDTDLNRLITCSDGQARVIYQGELNPGKFLRAPLPLPVAPLQGFVTVRATFCYASPVDPQDASAYTKAGLVVTYRPHDGRIEPNAMYPKSATFFPASEYRTEAELRTDLGKWETVLHAEHRFRGSSLQNPVFDVHYNSRDGGGAAIGGAQRIRYALVISIDAPKHPDLHSEILSAHAVLEALQPTISVPIRV